MDTSAGGSDLVNIKRKSDDPLEESTKQRQLVSRIMSIIIILVNTTRASDLSKKEATARTNALQELQVMP
jgi:hypothetical protein